jgi:putative ABC transport system ATP-binding protein
VSSLISLRGVSKRYLDASAPALRNVDLEIQDGSITAVMGPSGCGKSTLLNLIGGLDRPTAGEIVVAGTRVDQLTEAEVAHFRRANLGFVFQFFHLLESLSVHDNVAVAALLAGRPNAQADAMASERLREVGLERYAVRLPTALSGGERQRLAIARAIVNEPAIILADEPTGALDQRNGELVISMLEDLNRRGKTILLITHDERLAERRAHRVVRLVDGAVADDCRAREAS